MTVRNGGSTATMPASGAYLAPTNDPSRRPAFQDRFTARNCPAGGSSEECTHVCHAYYCKHSFRSRERAAGIPQETLVQRDRFVQTGSQRESTPKRAAGFALSRWIVAEISLWGGQPSWKQRGSPRDP